VEVNMRLVALLLGVMVLLVAGGVLGGVTEPPGLEAYSPTKLEWATVEFNARVMGTLGHRTNVRVYCTHSKPPNIVVCPVFRAPDMSQKTVSKAALVVGELFSQYKQERGFEWLELEFGTPSPIAAQLE